jgi:hypothetical protein
MRNGARDTIRLTGDQHAGIVAEGGSNRRRVWVGVTPRLNAPGVSALEKISLGLNAMATNWSNVTNENPC